MDRRKQWMVGLAVGAAVFFSAALVSIGQWRAAQGQGIQVNLPGLGVSVGDGVHVSLPGMDVVVPLTGNLPAGTEAGVDVDQRLSGSLAGISTLRIEGPVTGEVTLVSGAPAGTYEVHLTGRVPSAWADLVPEARASGSSLTFDVPRSRSMNFNTPQGGLQLEIRVGSPVDLIEGGVVTGTLTCEAPARRIDLHTQTGTLEVRVPGAEEVRAETTTGTLSVQLPASDWKVDASTVTGTISLPGLEEADPPTPGRSVHLERGAGTHVYRLKAVTGTIEGDS